MGLKDDVDYIEKKHLPPRTKLMLELIPDGTGTLLDIGCAKGAVTYYYSKKAKKAYGIDITKEHIDFARQRFPEITFVRCGIEKTPFENSFFDTIVFCSTMEHIEDEVACLKEIRRILKPDGTLIILVPHKGLFSFMDIGHFTSVHKHYSEKDLKDLLEKAGFDYKVEKIFKSGLLLIPLISNLSNLLTILFNKKISFFITKKLYLYSLTDFDFKIPYGRLSFYITMKVKNGC